MRYVLAESADGPVLVPHTEEEYRRFFDGVDVEASWAAVGPLETDDEKETP